MHIYGDGNYGFRVISTLICKDKENLTPDRHNLIKNLTFHKGYHVGLYDNKK